MINIAFTILKNIIVLIMSDLKLKPVKLNSVPKPNIHISGNNKNINFNGGLKGHINSKTSISGHTGYSGSVKGNGIKSIGIGIEHRPNNKYTLSGGITGNNRGHRSVIGSVGINL